MRSDSTVGTCWSKRFDEVCVVSDCGCGCADASQQRRRRAVCKREAVDEGSNAAAAAIPGRDSSDARQLEAATAERVGERDGQHPEGVARVGPDNDRDELTLRMKDIEGRVLSHARMVTATHHVPQIRSEVVLVCIQREGYVARQAITGKRKIPGR